MTDFIKLTIDWRDAHSEVPEQQQEAFTQQLLRELRKSSAIASADRVVDPNMPPGSMGEHWLWSILTAEIPGSGLRLACEEALNQLAGKPVEFTVEVNGQKIAAKHVRPDDFDGVVDKLVEAATKMKQ
jgi:hypothetical protein